MSEPASLPPGMPGYWMQETGGVLRDTVIAFLNGEPLVLSEVACIRAYLRQWINAFGFEGPAVAELRASVDSIVSRADLESWIWAAVDAGIDPL